MTVLQNLALGTVATAPSPAASGTTLVLGSGQGARFADPAVVGAYPVTIQAAGAPADPSNAEIALCTERSTDAITLIRAQEGTTARTVVAGDLVFAGETAGTVGERLGAAQAALWMSGVRT
jgi:hypothetical protein